MIWTLSFPKLELKDKIPSGAITAQLGAFDELHEAQKSWNSARKHLGSLLDQRIAFAIEVEDPSCEVYSDCNFFKLRIGYFESLTDVRKFCRETADLNQDCIPVIQR